MNSAYVAPPTNVTLLVNRNRVDPNSLVGLSLTTLEAVLSNADEQLSQSAQERKALSSAVSKAINAVRKTKSGSVTVEVTSSLNTESKTITHTIQVR